MYSFIGLSGTSMLSWIVLLSIKGSVIIALVLLIQRLGRNVLPAQARYWLWIPALFCLFIPFGFATTWSPFTSLIGPAPPAQVEPSLMQSAPAELAAEPRSLRLSDFWFLGILAFSGAVFYNLIRFQRIQHNSRPAGESAQKLLQRCKNELGIRRRIRLLETQEVSTPFIFGWIRPTILLPTGLTREISNSELRFVLLHELAHVKHYDIALSWLMTTVQILHWFNPLVWYGFRRMRRDHEIACDAAVLRHLRPAEYAAYGHTLILLMERYPRGNRFSQGLGIVGNTKPMKERLHMIKRFKTFQKGNVILGAVALLVVATLAFSENRVNAHEEHSDASEGDSPTLQEQIRALHDRIIAIHGPHSDDDSEAALRPLAVDVLHDVIEVITKRAGQDFAFGEGDRSDEGQEDLRKHKILHFGHGDGEERDTIRVLVDELESEESDLEAYVIEIVDGKLLISDKSTDRFKGAVRLNRDALDTALNIIVRKREIVKDKNRVRFGDAKRKYDDAIRLERDAHIRYEEHEARSLRAAELLYEAEAFLDWSKRAGYEQAKAEIEALEMELKAKKLDLEKRIRMEQDDRAEDDQ